MKVVILCGGQGTRLKEETEYRPKPLVPIGGMPILWHIMKTYSRFGHKDFILCLGYKGEMIKDYFLNFQELTNDFTLSLRSHKKLITHHKKAVLEDWNITFVDTGMDSQTGARVARIKEFIGKDKEFLLTYGDGVARIDIGKLIKFHRAHGPIATVTGVRPPSRFGEIVAKGARVVSFNEKPAVSEGYINGGFFVLDRKIFNYVSRDETCVFERDPLETLVRERRLAMFAHDGFWHCMDTYRDYLALNELWDTGQASWKVWK